MNGERTRYESWLFRTMNNPAIEWARPRRVRRMLVLAMVALPIGFAGVMWALPSLWWFAGLLAIFVPLMGSLNGGIRGLTELRQHQLDEREGRVRDSAYRKVFWRVAAVAAVGSALMLRDGLSPEQRAGFAMASFILILTMPTLYLAWTLPDEIKDEA
jgi:uncharacterized membrane protein